MDNPRLERARRKHNALVAGLARMQAKRDKMLSSLMRNEKRIDLQIRAVTRSSKRMDRLAIAIHNGGPTMSAVPALIEAVAAKEVAAPPLNDKVPTFGKKKPTSAEHKTEAGPLPPRRTCKGIGWG